MTCPKPFINIYRYCDALKWLFDCRLKGGNCTKDTWWPFSLNTKPFWRNMITSSNGNVYHVTGPFCGEHTGHWWIPLTKASDAELWCFFICAWTNGWVNNRGAGDLRRNRAHYDVTVMNNHTRESRLWVYILVLYIFVRIHIIGQACVTVMSHKSLGLMQLYGTMYISGYNVK